MSSVKNKSICEVTTDTHLPNTNKVHNSPSINRHPIKKHQPILSQPAFAKAKPRTRMKNALSLFQAQVHKSKLSFEQYSEQFACVNIHQTKNNIHASISNLFGVRQIKWHSSGGVYTGGINGRRKSRFIQRQLLTQLQKKLRQFQTKYIVVQCFGRISSNHKVFYKLNKKFNILLVKDITPIAHNGCRLPKQRKV